MIAIPNPANEKSLLQYLKSYLAVISNQYGSEKVKIWAQKMGITSRITFKHILAGRKKLSSSQVTEVMNALDLGNEDRLRFSKNEVCETKVTAEKIFVSEDFFKTPLNTIILNLCSLKKSCTMPMISNNLKSFFSEQEIREAIATLMELKLIQKKDDESLQRIFHGTITTIPGVKSLSSREYFKQSYALADRAWEAPLHLRELNAFSVRLCAQDIPKLKDLVRKFREDVSVLSPPSESDCVYQCAIAAAPIYIEKHN